MLKKSKLTLQGSCVSNINTKLSPIWLTMNGLAL